MLNDQSRDFLLCLLWFFLYRLLYLVIVRYKIKRDGSNIHRQFSHEYGKGQSSSICNKLVAAPSGVAADDVEWCTYVISTVHAVVVVCVITAFLLKAGPWTTEEMVFGTSPTLRHLFDFSLAYFVSDGFLMTVWKLEGWAVMAAHHAVAGLPYAVYNFAPGCRCGLFVLALFLLVEVCTLPLNARWFFERGAAAGKPAALAKPGGRAREGYQAVAQEEAPLDWPSLI